MSKRLKPYLNFLEDSGLRVLDITTTGSTHKKISVTSKGSRRFFVVPTSTSDRRSFENWKSDVRKWVREINAKTDNPCARQNIQQCAGRASSQAWGKRSG